MAEIIGYICALFVGVILGILGGGGAILGVPVLVYLMKVDELQATGYSLFIVGTSSFVGAANYLRKHPEQRKTILNTVLWFAPPTILVGIGVRTFIKKVLPTTLLRIDHFEVTKNNLVMLCFAVIMVIVALKMLAKSRAEETSTQASFANIDLLKNGVIAGIVAGIAGSGAGFLITPVLVKYMKMPMKMAVGVSLWIISANSWLIFAGDTLTGKNMGQGTDWKLLLTFTALAIIGILIGNRLSGRVSNQKLKQGFGYFVLLTGTVIISIEVLASFNII